MRKESGVARLRQATAAAGLLGGLAGWSIAVQAQAPAHWEGQIKAALMYFRYEEFNDDDGVLDREAGYLPGVSAGIGRVSGPWGVHGEVTVNVGTADYTGETTGGAGPPLPVTTQTSERIVNAHARIERWSSRDAQWRAGGYAGIGYRGWNRDISGTRIGNIFVGGVTEYYETGYWMLGAKASAGLPVSQWTLDLRVQRTFGPRMHLKQSPLNDALTFELGERASPAASLGWQSQRGSGTTLGVEVFFEQWEFGRSPTTVLTQGGVPIGTVYEPESRTRSYGLRAGVTSAF